ncbi:MAG: hypothetical protein K2M98_06955, partial [Muribaculum sp.]|nr:hypothetical protein [Muribaculum sp.]
PDPRTRRPAWFITILVLLSLPLLATPAYLARIPEDNGIFLCFPLYVLLSVYLAYASWPQRQYLAWILIGVLVLSYISLLFIL